MTEFSLDKEFDSIILGTGLPESVLAAGLSRIGRTVLHLDRNGYYGSDSAVFSFDGLLHWSGIRKSLQRDDLLTHGEPDCIESGEVITPLSLCSQSISEISYTVFSVSTAEQEICEKIVNEELKKAAADQQAQQLLLDAESSSTDVIVENADSTLADEEKLNSSLEAKQSENIADNSSEQIDELEPVSGANNRSAEAEGDGNIKEAGDGNIKEDGGGRENIFPVVNSIVKAYVQDLMSKGLQENNDSKFQFFLSCSRHFNLDLSPKVLYSKSALIDLLISSDVARYCEFRSLTRILTCRNERLELVPCSRSDIFSTTSISMIEKRILMKFLTLCSNTEANKAEIEEFATRKFVDFLHHMKLTVNLIHYVKNAIAMVSGRATTAEGIEKCQKFLLSVGRYGPTSFLWPMYGGEITQSFCRMSAVFGGVYVLQRTARCIVHKEGRVCGIVCNEGERFTCKSLIVNADYLRLDDFGSGDKKYICRAIVIACGSIMPSDKEEATMLSIPNKTDPDGEPVTVIELGYAAAICPSTPTDLRVCHLTMNSAVFTGSPEENMKAYVDSLFCRDGSDVNRPRMMFALYFKQLNYSKTLHPEVPQGVYVTDGPDDTLDYDNAVHKARYIFETICPGEEFLPKPPNPEDIIFCDNSSKTAADENNFTNDEQKFAEHTVENIDKIIDDPANSNSNLEVDELDKDIKNSG